MKTFSGFLVILITTTGCATRANQENLPWGWTFEVSVDRPSPVSSPFKLKGQWRMIRESDGRQIPVQIKNGRATWIASPDETLYRMVNRRSGFFWVGLVEDVKGSHISIRFGKKVALQYKYGVVKAPDGADPAYDRSGYIHPIHTPDGRVITNDFPKNHLHHHGAHLSSPSLTSLRVS